MMQPTPEQPSGKEERDEERLMVLLALNSQALPERHAHAKDPQEMSADELHAYLDADPAAFGEFLRRHRPALDAPRAGQHGRSWRDALRGWGAPFSRYALAFGIAGLCAVAIVLVLRSDERPTRLAELGRGYEELRAGIDARSLPTIATDGGNEARLGFAPLPGATTAAAASFALGIGAGRERLMSGRDAGAVDVTNEPFFILGQWNVLLAAACESQQPLTPAFWRNQRSRLQPLIVELKQNARADAALTAHLQRVDASLARLAQRYSPRRAFELGEELRLFRAQLMPDGERR